MKQNRRNSQVINEEVFFDEDKELVSTTDLRGVTTYANDVFCNVAGYEEGELVGKNHNMVRHPDMPAAAFKDLWDHLKLGNSWRGVVKNRCKDGRYYWVDAYVTPIKENGKVVGYQSVRVKPSNELKQRAQRIYDAVNSGNASDVTEMSSTKKQLATGFIVVLFSGLLGYYSGLVPVGLFILALLLLCVTYRVELFQTPRLTSTLQKNFDSVSRFVFSGKGATSIINFHFGLIKARSRTILGRFVDLSHNLSKVGQTLTTISDQALESVEQQKLELEQIATAMNEMTVTSHEIAKNSSETLTKVEQTTEKCKEAQQLMVTNSNSIGELSKDVSIAAESANELRDEIVKVNGMMNEINGIAEQTNLLALNAAIEAARAGEQGRGFAVVADEVRSLSTRTQSSSEEIQTSMAIMVKTIESWAAIMERNTQNTEHCQDTASSTSDLVENVNKMMLELTDFSTLIATAAEEQGLVAEEINRNVQSVNDLGILNVENAHIVKDNANEIGKAINYINNVSHTFKE